ncbi:MAG: peroxidase-related enzyme [Actinomycetia bacterium]|nr:peroxidase-related enzyme [Actinomycetes bacterium]
MATHPISRYPVPDLEDMPEDVREAILAVQEKAGFIPNVFLALAHRPAEFRAFFAYHDALMDKDTALTKADREMIVVATSGDNHCQYCVVAHGAILRIRTKDTLVADQVAINYHKADITPRETAILDFALKVSNESHLIDEEDSHALFAFGLTSDDVWDIGSIVGLFGFSNRLANFASIRPNDEFYTMAR